MGRVVKLVSDVSGVEADESAFEKCVVRRHPVISEANGSTCSPENSTDCGTSPRWS